MKTPLLDKRNYEDIVEEMRSLVPHFTPEWNFDSKNPDVGSALFMVFAMQLKETIDLLNKSLYKNFLSFLNMSDIMLKPTKSSKAPVVFTLTSDNISVFIEKGTKLSSSIGEDINFETEDDVEVVPIKIKSCHYASDIEDKIIKLNNPTNINLFDYSNKDNIQAHEIFILDDKLFNIKSNVDVVIRFSYDKLTKKHLDMLSCLSNTQLLCWEYYVGDEGWVKFDEVEQNESCLILKKRNSIELKLYEPFNSRAIRVKLNEKVVKYYEGLYINLMDIQIRRRANFFDDYSISSDGLFNNDKKISTDNIMPYGLSFNVSDYFYIGSDEVFTKANSHVSINMLLSFIDDYNKKVNSDNVKWKLIMKKSEFELEIPPICSIKDVEWQYFNGTRWEPLKVNTDGREVFYCELDEEELNNLARDINNLSGHKELFPSDNNIQLEKSQNEKTIRKKTQGAISFYCPEDFKPTEIGGQKGYFIRGEIKSIENNYEYKAVAMIPIVDSLSLSYDYENNFESPSSMITLNNNETKHYTYELREQKNYIAPFYGVNSRYNVLYLCIDKPIECSSVNLLFIINKAKNNIDKCSIHAEYLTRKNNDEYWKEISISDRTNGFTQTGIITLLGLHRFLEKNIFGQSGYWLRFTLNCELVAPRIIENIYFNGVWAVQQTTVRDEYLDIDIDTQRYKLFFTPVLNADVWVNEIKALNKKEIEEIIEKGELVYEEGYDEQGILTEFWIKWNEADSLIGATINDRLYVVNRRTGEISFGNGIVGKRPPAINKAIKVSYSYGGGQIGNVGCNCVNSLYESKAFIDKVFNPISAIGGVDAESIDEAIARETKKIKHQNNAISATDIENIILSNFSDIVDVRCLSNIDSNFRSKKGDVNIIVLPRADVNGEASNMLNERIHSFLQDKLPMVLTRDKLHISGVTPIKINVKAVVYCNANDNPYYIKSAIEKRLDKFLSFKEGNFNSKGWRINEIPKKHAIYATISKIEGANITEIKNLIIAYENDLNVNAVEMNAEEVDKIANGIVANGKHEIIVIANNAN